MKNETISCAKHNQLDSMITKNPGLIMGYTTLNIQEVHYERESWTVNTFYFETVLFYGL